MARPVSLQPVLSAKHSRFVAEFVRTGDLSSAADAAGITEQQRRGLIREPALAAAIHSRMLLELTVQAPVALQLLAKVMRDDRAPANVRVAAAKDLLDRAGYVAPKAKASDPVQKTLQEMSTDELRAIVEQGQAQLAAAARPIDAADAAPAPSDLPDFYD